MKKITHVIQTSMITNLLLALCKLVFGFFGKSSALVADGVHSFSDLSTDVVAFFGSKLASKPADDKHPFGHGKLEYLTSLAIGIVVLAIGLSLIARSMNREVIIPGVYVIFVSLFTIVVKYALASYLIHSGKRYNNSILIASGKESSADVISSFVVLISGICMQFSTYVSVFKYADIVGSVLVGLFIVHTGFSLIKENVSVIIGEQETDQSCLEQIKNELLSDSNVICIDRLNVLKFGYFRSVICELSMDGVLSLHETHKIIDDLEKKIKDMDDRYEYITIHVNPK